VGSTTFQPSLIGYATRTLNVPGTYSFSQIGYTTTTLYSPGETPGYGDSLIGFATTALNAPHRPVAVLMSDGTLKYAPVRTWDGTRLR
jgi:hypothetical protein